jgi:hypothetical protein
MLLTGVPAVAAPRHVVMCPPPPLLLLLPSLLLLLLPSLLLLLLWLQKAALHGRNSSLAFDLVPDNLQVHLGDLVQTDTQMGHLKQQQQQ